MSVIWMMSPLLEKNSFLPRMEKRLTLLAFLLLFASPSRPSRSDSSEYPWSYDLYAFGGPEWWGVLEKRWEMCRRGKLQSPIDIRPNHLLYDPRLTPIHFDRQTVASELVNTGQLPRVRIGNSVRRPPANMSGGPLGNYRYRVQRIDIHFGGHLDPLRGSEHTIQGSHLPMELQLVAFNSDLYSNFSVAVRSPHGIAILSILVDLGTQTNEELLKLTIATASVAFKNKRVELPNLAPWGLLPLTRHYITYSGSITSPGCYETVTWMILNQPIHITSHHLEQWSRMLKSSSAGPADDFLAPNLRPIQPDNHRLIRTNIHPRKFKDSIGDCSLPLSRLTYRSNIRAEGISSGHNSSLRRHSNAHLFH